MPTIILLVPVLVVCMFSTGCATLVTGSGHDQSVRVSSEPRGADVYVNNSLAGKTPMSVRLSRKDDQFVRVEMEGYKPYQATLKTGFNGWVFGNILFGGVTGLVIDLLSGASDALSPNDLKVTLVKAKDAPAASVAAAQYRQPPPAPPASPANAAVTAAAKISPPQPVAPAAAPARSLAPAYKAPPVKASEYGGAAPLNNSKTP